MSLADTTPPDLAEIEAAAERLAPVAVRTPLLESPALNALVGGRLLLKAECLQRTGSFKFRGAYNRLSLILPADRAKGVVAFSSGNHAQGVAAAAQLLGVAATIIMPQDAPAAKIDATRGYGAEVVTYDRARDSREAIGAEISAATGATLVRPYDDRGVIAGQGTVGLEIAAQAADLGAEIRDVLVCCSGGGLASGVAIALAAKAPTARVRTAEPAGFDDFARSLADRQPRRNDRLTGSICDALLAPEPGEITWLVGSRLFAPGLAADDAAVRAAMRLAFRHLKLVLEPGGACALACALGAPDLTRGRTTVVVLSGGNVDDGLYAEVLAAA